MPCVSLRISSLVALTLISLPSLGSAAQGKPFDSVLVKRAVLARALDDVAACRSGPPIWSKPAITEEVGKATIVGEGGLLFHDLAMKKARLFSSNGAELAQLGGRGGGPGEFAPLAVPAPWDGDTVAMYDYTNARITLYTAKGMARAINLADVPALATGGFMGRLTNGDLIFGAGLALDDPPTTPSGIFRGNMKLVRWRSGAASVDTLRRDLPGPEWYPVVNGKRRGVLYVSFGRRTSVATVGPEAVVHDNAVPRVVFLDSRGQPARVVRLEVSDPPVSTLDRDTLLASTLERMKGNQPPPAMWELMNNMPKTRAATLWQGADGRGFWLAFPPPVARETPVYVRFSTHGAPTHCFRPRDGTRVLAVGVDRLVTVRNDLEGDEIAVERAASFPTR